MNTMKSALGINLIFSALSGMMLLIFHAPIATYFGVAASRPFWIIGIALLLFALLIFREMRRLHPKGIQLIIVQDMLWVVGSLILLLLNPFQISTEGNYVIAIIAFIVLMMGINQYRALKKIKLNTDI